MENWKCAPRSCCCTLTFWILHFEVYDILKCKNFLIGFLNELGNFKQKKIYISKCNLFFTFYSNGPIKQIYIAFVFPFLAHCVLVLLLVILMLKVVISLPTSGNFGDDCYYFYKDIFPFPSSVKDGGGHPPMLK